MTGCCDMASLPNMNQKMIRNIVIQMGMSTQEEYLHISALW